VGLERGPLSLVSTTEKLLEIKSSGSENTAVMGASRWPRGTLYPQKLALTSTTSGDRSVGILRSRTQVAEILISLPKNVAQILDRSHVGNRHITPSYWYFPLLSLSLSLPPFVLQRVKRSLKPFWFHLAEGRQRTAKSPLGLADRKYLNTWCSQVAVQMWSLLSQVQDGSCHPNY
jgi:hypothetical protein